LKPKPLADEFSNQSHKMIKEDHKTVEKDTERYREKEGEREREREKTHKKRKL